MMFTETAGVDAAMIYLTHADQKPVSYNPPPGAGQPRRDGDYAAYPVRVLDGRAIAAKLSPDRQGFLLARHATGVADFYDDDAVRDTYYPEVERLVADATGAARVVVFDHTRRRRRRRERRQGRARAGAHDS